jgi:hypothetical protein
MGHMPTPKQVSPEARLLRAALALGALDVPGVSAEERALVAKLPDVQIPRSKLRDLRADIKAGWDPLGDEFCEIRTPEERRPDGATYTPFEIVDAMIAWAAGEGEPDRVIDPGVGSARFAVEAGRTFKRATLIGVELDPVAAILARAHLAAAGLASRARVELADYRSFRPEKIEGRTLYLGNPPYVRHHQIDPAWKSWLVTTARSYGLAASQLAGLHVHFFLATAASGKAGDCGAFITSAEWLDVNYGSLVRELLLNGLGGQAIHVLEPTAMPFEDAATTAAITCFRLGAQPKSLTLRRVKEVAELGDLGAGQKVRRERLLEARRWTPLTRASRKLPDGYVELGELCRVHRGAVTGSNATWIVAPDFDLLPEHVLYPSITRARELFAAKHILREIGHLRQVVDLPLDLDVFEQDERKVVDCFLREAKRNGAHQGYIARHRKAWWSVGLPPPAPILATYMARRPPVFVRNTGDARHINIAHGLYPRQPMTASVLERLAKHLRESVSLAQGRTYAGGLTKFEPKEMERLPVPNLELLTA